MTSLSRHLKISRCLVEIIALMAGHRDISQFRGDTDWADRVLDIVVMLLFMLMFNPGVYVSICVYVCVHKYSKLLNTTSR